MDIEHCHEILDKEFIHTNLLKWYDKHRRKLPWRGDFPPFGSSDQNVMLNWIKPPKVVKQEKVSPYGTWVSEIMLQQTRVDTVVGYYLKWMEEFPTVKALADADAEVGYAVFFYVADCVESKLALGWIGVLSKGEDAACWGEVCCGGIRWKVAGICCRIAENTRNWTVYGRYELTFRYCRFIEE